MSRKTTKTGSVSRRPSLSRIKDTESNMLLWEGKVIFYGSKMKEVDNDLKNLDKSKVRLKTTKRIELMKAKTSYDAKQKAAQKKAKAYGDRLKSYSSVQW